MKIAHILTIIVSVALLQSCNQLEDEINALDLQTSVAADLDYTLTDDDYDLVDKNFGTFDSDDEAKELIPTILTENYPQFGDGSSALVYYDLYDPIRINEAVEFELADADYEALDHSFGTLSSDRDILEAVEYKYPTPEANDLVTLTYEWWCGGCDEQGTRTSKVTEYGGAWYVSYEPTDEDYEFMGQSFPNFSSRTAARNNISYVLTQRYPFDDAETIRTSVFTYTYVNSDGDRQFEDFMAVFEFDGAAYIPFQDVVTRSLQLGHDGTAWVPDNTIKYSLNGGDYTAISEATADSNPNGSESLGNYSNYDLGLWTDDQIQSSIADYLLEIFPKVEDQKYLVTYATWEPGAGMRDLHLIYKGDKYILVE